MAISKELETLFQSKKQAVIEELQNALTSIHISFDLWTSPNRLAFIAVFTHFLNRHRKYQRRLIAFRRQLGAHSGKNIAQTLHDIIQDWGFGSRLRVAICDNAGNNDTCLQVLYPQFFSGIKSTDIQARRMRCFGHILNLVAKAFLFGSEDYAFELKGDFLEQIGQYDQAQAHWRRKGPIGKLHNIIKFIRASPQRSEAFKKAAKENEAGDVPDGFRLSDESTAELELRQNNATRWNSTYLMIERAWQKQADIQAYIMTLDMLPDKESHIPDEDRLTVDDWRMLGELQHILEPIYLLTMRTQGWVKGDGHGQLWEVMTGMEYVMEQLEDWKTLYLEETAALPPLEPQSPEPIRQLRQRQRLPQAAGQRFNEAALPGHTRAAYTTLEVRSVSMIGQLQDDERIQVRACINNAWVKLDQYYTLLGQSPLFAAAIILHPGLGLPFLEANWTSAAQLQWLWDAKRETKAYLDQWYPDTTDLFEASSTPTPNPTPIPPLRDPSAFTQWIQSRQSRTSETASELERYYRLEPHCVDDPVQWWLDRRNSFPRLSRFALDLLAIPAMADDCERAFSVAKLTITSQRHALGETKTEQTQLMKNWIRNAGMTLGGDPPRYQINQSNNQSIRYWPRNLKQIRYWVVSDLIDLNAALI